MTENTSRAITAAFLTIVMVACTFLVLREIQQLRGDVRNPPLVRWEYMVVSPDDEGFEGEVNRLGREGWEMVTARRANMQGRDANYEVILKRPVGRK